jgi:hypothetical protein
MPVPIPIPGVPNVGQLGRDLVEFEETLVRDPAFIRTTGALKAVGGAFEMAGGAMLSEFPLLGGAFIFHGADVFQSGINQLRTAEYWDDYTVKAGDALGIPRAARFIDTSMTIVGGVGVPIAAELGVIDEIASAGRFAARVPGDFAPVPTRAEVFGLPNPQASRLLMTQNEILTEQSYCTDLALSLKAAAGGEGKVVVFSGSDARWPTQYRENIIGELNVQGTLGRSEFAYHSAYTDGKYFFDPFVSSKPLPQGAYLEALKSANPNGISWRIYDIRKFGPPGLIKDGM